MTFTLKDSGISIGVENLNAREVKIDVESPLFAHKEHVVALIETLLQHTGIETAYYVPPSKDEFSVAIRKRGLLNIT